MIQFEVDISEFAQGLARLNAVAALVLLVKDVWLGELFFAGLELGLIMLFLLISKLIQIRQTNG